MFVPPTNENVKVNRIAVVERNGFHSWKPFTGVFFNWWRQHPNFKPQTCNSSMMNKTQKTHPKTRKRKCTSTRKLDPANFFKKHVCCISSLGGCHVFFPIEKKHVCPTTLGTWRQKSLRVSACFVSLCQLHQAPKDLHHKPGVPKNTLPANGQDFFGLKSWEEISNHEILRDYCFGAGRSFYLLRFFYILMCVVYEFCTFFLQNTICMCIEFYMFTPKILL